MKLTDNEVEILKAALPSIRNCPVVEHILNGDLSCQDTEKVAMNAYHKEAVIYSLVYGYAQLFFIGRECSYSGLYSKVAVISDLADYLKIQLRDSFHNYFLEAMYAAPTKKYEIVEQTFTEESCTTVYAAVS